MSYRLFFKNEAKEDLFEISQWYETQKEGLGVEFINTITAECSHLIQFPFAFPA